MRPFWMAVLTSALVACGPGSERRATEGGDVIDSVLPMDVMLARFREGVSRPAGLHGDLGDRDSLVGQVIRALETGDTLAFERLAVSRAEWAWLYFPTSVLSHPPYELQPGLAWFQLQEANRKGVFRALREYGGRTLDYRGYRCNVAPTREGDNRLWTSCTVTLARDGARPVPVRLFGAILEQGGRYLILSYANDF